MRTPAFSDTVQLAKGEILRVDDSQITQITVLAGILWITETPSSGDILLRSGECHRFGKDYPHVIEPITEATVLLGTAICNLRQSVLLKSTKEPGSP